MPERSPPPGRSLASQRLTVDLLFGDPSGMTLNIRVSLDLIKGGELLSQGHFIIVVMDAVVAQATNQNALVEFRLRKVLLKTGAAVELFGNEVVKGQGDRASTQGTIGDLISNHNWQWGKALLASVY